MRYLDTCPVTVFSVVLLVIVTGYVAAAVVTIALLAGVTA